MPSLSPLHSAKKTGPWSAMTDVIIPNGQTDESDDVPQSLIGLVHACTFRKIDYREIQCSHGVLHMTYHRLEQDPLAIRMR